MTELESSKRDTQWLVDMLMPMILGTKHRRISIENEWLLNYKAWQGWPSQSYTLPLPDNAVHYFIPHARRAIEKNVKRITKLLMSNIDWFETLPSDSTISDDAAEAVHTTLRYILSKKVRTKRNISQLARVTYLYDFAALHTSVVIQRKEVWPYQRVVDPYCFYIYPDTAIDLEDAILLFEESIVPYQIYKSFVSKNEKDSLYLDIPLNKLHLPEWPYHLVERVAYRGLTLPSDYSQGMGNTRRYVTEVDVQEARGKAKESLASQSKAFVHLYKCYFRVGSSWYYTVIANNTDVPMVVRLDEEETSPTYRWTNTRSLPGELYTNSETDDIRVLQNLSNTSLSQMESHRSTHAEPPIIADQNVLGRMQEYTYGNRKFWKVDGDVDKAFRALDTNDTSSENMKAVQIYMQLIDQHSGGQLPQGSPGRNMPRSGGATMTLLNMAMIDVEDIASTLEQDILTPSLSDIYKNILLYVPDSQLFKIPNKNPQLVKAYARQDLQGDYSFTWLGALGFNDQKERSERFLSFLTLILNPGILPVLSQQLQEQGLMLDIASAIRTVYTFGLGERGLGDIIKPISPQILQGRQQQQRPDPKMLVEMMKLQESQQRMSLDKAKAVGDIQQSQLKAQGIAIENKGKILDLALKRGDLEGKDTDNRVKRLQYFQSMFDQPLE